MRSWRAAAILSKKSVMTCNILSIDLGTSRVKLGIVNDRLVVLAAASARYPTFVDQDDMAEQRPEDWINAISQAWSEVRGAHVPTWVLTPSSSPRRCRRWSK